MKGFCLWQKITSLGFYLLALITVAASVAGGEVKNFAVYKGVRFYQQQPEGSPHPNANGHFVCELQVGGPGLLSAQVETPGEVIELNPSINGLSPFLTGGLFRYGANVGTGEFRFTIQTEPENQETATLTLNGDSYPSTPKMELPPGFLWRDFESHLTRLHSPYDSQTDLRLEWEEFADREPNDFIQVAVLLWFGTGEVKTVFRTPGFGEPGMLPASATEVTIPGGTLPPNSRFYTYLRFYRVREINSTGIPGATGISASFSELMMEIRTDTSDYGQPYEDTIAPELQSVHVEEASQRDWLEVDFYFSESLPIENSRHFVEWSENAGSVQEINTSNGVERRSLRYSLRDYAPGAEITWTLHNVRDWAGNPLPEAQSSGSFRTAPEEKFEFGGPVWEVPYLQPGGYVQYPLSAPDLQTVIIESSTDLRTWTPISTNQVQEGKALLHVDPTRSPAEFRRARTVDTRD